VYLKRTANVELGTTKAQQKKKKGMRTGWKRDTEQNIGECLQSRVRGPNAIIATKKKGKKRGWGDMVKSWNRRTYPSKTNAPFLPAKQNKRGRRERENYWD